MTTMNLQGFTPLMQATCNGNLKIMKLLLAAGADATATNVHVSSATITSLWYTVMLWAVLCSCYACTCDIHPNAAAKLCNAQA